MVLISRWRHRLFFSICFILSSSWAFPFEEDLSRWSLKEKVGQLFFLGYRNLKQIEEIKPGGVILFKWSLKNIEGAKNLTSKINKFAAKKLKAPAFIAIDHEGGSVIRLKKGMTPFPDAAAISANMDVKTSFKVGKLMGHELAALGINTNLAPVLDLGNARSFLQNRVWGARPEEVAKQTKYFIRGMRSAGIFSIAKHFPGHGASSDVNAHFHLPKFRKKFDKLWVEDLMPFREAIQDEIEALMTAHVSVANIDPRQPASLSERFVQDILRKKMGFKGLVVTDDLEMGGVYNEGRNGSVEDLALKSLQAGTDIIMVVWSYKKQKKIRDRILQAIKRGEYSEVELDEKLRRIFALKKKYLLKTEKNPYWKELLRHPQSMEFALDISKKAIQWETGNSPEMTSLLNSRWDESWNVVLPKGTPKFVWSKIRPNDRIIRYGRVTDQRLTNNVQRLIRSADQKKEVFVVITRPLVYMNKEFVRMLRKSFNDVIRGSTHTRAMLWMHQGSIPLRIKNKHQIHKVGLVSLHSTSAKSLIHWAEAFKKGSLSQNKRWN